MEQDYGILTHRTLIAEWKRLLRETKATHVEVDMDELGTDGESYTHIPEAIRFLEKHKKKLY